MRINGKCFETVYIILDGPPVRLRGEFVSKGHPESKRIEDRQTP